MEKCLEIEKSIAEKLEDGLNTKVSQREFETFKKENYEPSIKNLNDWVVYLRNIIYGAIFTFFGVVGTMYFFYFQDSGSRNKELTDKINKMEISLATIQQSVAQINKTLGNAEIVK